jgi:hypothetical protein
MDKLKVIIVFLLCIIGLGFSNMTKKLLNRLVDNVNYFQCKTIPPIKLVDGNIIFFAKSSSSWFCSPMDFNFSYFKNQSRINNSHDTLFNCSLIEESNVKLVTSDDRTILDASLLWSGEGFVKFLREHYGLTKITDLQKINRNTALLNYAYLKRVQYFLVDNDNLNSFKNYKLIRVYPPRHNRENSRFSYALIDTINLIQLK